ncbi:MmgE/PrpD family protein [Amycolatopsis sp. K13G38]|uniref:MmgE/PrpD family protein n=1 Tax=Amycolatopsis acididurans TaxID=2724524 RepID=A0ABX1J6X1_9PSEU|nr:MmgE/PrpD family protein [Amycolatopsis acididurans]NKQ55547.1 MmgE/PrpD family protein [Amycolatopsis acididurans]
MSDTVVRVLADFTSGTRFQDLPSAVVDETKRILLDSIGCALGGVNAPKGSIGGRLAHLMGEDGSATIIGNAGRTSVFGAAFANGELINALDFDAILPPGHVAPYVIPGALAVAEQGNAGGEDLITAVALAHEMSYRFGKSMDYHRDTSGGKADTPAVLGFASTVFGATAAVGRVRDLAPEIVANALGIAGSISPVNSHRSWLMHAPTSTIKYTMAGPIVQAALTASYSAEYGHTGDQMILDDAEYGYRRFIGARRWATENLLDELGTTWRFPAESTHKPYPHCRVMHAPFEALTEILEGNDIRPEEIDAIRAWGEGWVGLPVWLNDRIEQIHDGQFSVHHGLAVAAQRIQPGPAWQDPGVVYDEKVLAMMEKVTFQGHPDALTALTRDSRSRPTRIEVDARGTTFTAERCYPKGTPSPEPQTYMTTGELADKFRINAAEVLPARQTEDAVDALLNLERLDDIGKLMGLVSVA